MARSQIPMFAMAPTQSIKSVDLVEIDAANGMVMSRPGWVDPLNAETILLITNTTAADKAVTIKGTDNPRAQNRDDMVVTVPAGGFVAVRLDHYRTRQGDGTTLIDFEADMTGLIGAVQLRG